MKKLPEIFRKKVEPNHINNKQVYYGHLIVLIYKKNTLKMQLLNLP